MYCEKCGAELPEGSLFCSKCSNTIGAKEIKQDVPHAPEFKSNDIPYVAGYSSNEEVIIKKSSSKKVVGIVAAVLVLILALGFLAKDQIIYAISPELSIKLAMTSTLNDLSKELNKMNSLFYKYDKTNLSSTADINIVVKDFSSTETYNEGNLPKGVGFAVNSVYDDKNKEFYLGVAFSMAGDEMVSMKLKLDDNELLFSMPELLDKMIRVPSKTFGKEYNSSPLCELTGSTIDEDLDISVSNLMINSTNNPPNKLEKISTDKFDKSFKLLFEDSKYEKDGTVDLEIDGKAKKCNKTILTLNNDNIKKGLISLIDDIKSDESIIQYIKDKDNAQLEKLFDDENLAEIERSIMEDYPIEKARINFYSNNGKIVKLEMQLIEDINYEEDMVSLNVALLGGKTMIDSVKIEVISPDTVMLFESQGNHTGQKNIFTDKTRININANYGETFDIEYEIDLDLNKKTDNLKANIKIMNEDTEVVINTNANFDSSTEGLEFKTDDLDIKDTDSYGEITTMKFSVLYKLSNDISKKPDFSSSEKIELFKIDENEIYGLVYSIQDNAIKIEEKLEDKIGNY